MHCSLKICKVLFQLNGFLDKVEILQPHAHQWLVGVGIILPRTTSSTSYHFLSFIQFIRENVGDSTCKVPKLNSKGARACKSSIKKTETCFWSSEIYDVRRAVFDLARYIRRNALTLVKYMQT